MNENWQEHLKDASEDQYVEIKQQSKICAILNLQQEKHLEEHKESILKIIDEKPIHQQDEKKKTKPNFIVDDRERQILCQKQPTIKQSQQPNLNKDTNIEEKEIKKDQRQEIKIEKKRKYTEKKNDLKGTQIQNDKTKKQNYQQKQSYERENNDQKRRQKYKQKQPLTKTKKQIQEIDGRIIEHHLIDEDQDYQNEIYIGKRDQSIYLEKARSLIKNYDFIVLKSFGIFVYKAFIIAGLLSEEIPKMKQINIPDIVKVKTLDSQKETINQKGAIRIQLSLLEGQLEIKHIGYQQSKTFKNNKSKYQSKPEEKSNPKPKYIEKNQQTKRTDNRDKKFEKEQRKNYKEKNVKKESYNRRRDQSYSSDQRRLR